MAGRDLDPASAASPALFDDRFTLDSPTGAALNVYRAHPRGEPHGILLVQHGLAEHAGRYARFAGEMAALGLAVYAHDHRGHGSTSALDAPMRRFAKANGAAKVVADSGAVIARARAEHPDLPAIVFGHSMGGLIALNLAEHHGREVAGLAVWNANFTFGLQERLGVFALRAERALKGSDVASDVLRRATFDAWAKSVSPRTSALDWLSHDENSVEAYRTDPLCGWTPTVSMAADLVDLVRIGGSQAHLAQVPPDLPIHLLGGGADPATSGGKAVTALAGLLRLNGCRDVTTAIIEGARHETLNETATLRDAALRSFVDWLDRVLTAAAARHAHEAPSSSG